MQATLWTDMSELGDKIYYRIKDVAEMVGENPSTLRYWEKEFGEIKPQRTGNGPRLYTADDIETLRKIKYLLRTKGMHIMAAKEQLRANFKNISTRTEALQHLEKAKEGLELLLKSLSKIR